MSLETKDLPAEARPPAGRRLAASPRPMKGLNRLLSRMNGWALSLALHGGVAALAAISVFGVHVAGGGSGGTGGSAHAGVSGDSFPARMHSGDEEIVNGS